jgi:hypothetical protein
MGEGGAQAMPNSDAQNSPYTEALLRHFPANITERARVREKEREFKNEHLTINTQRTLGGRV